MTFNPLIQYGMPKAPSPSRVMTQCEKCERQVFLDHVYRSSGSIYTRRGTAVHDALEDLAQFRIHVAPTWEEAFRAWEEVHVDGDEIQVKPFVRMAFAVLKELEPRYAESWIDSIIHPTTGEETTWKGKIDLVCENTPILNRKGEVEGCFDEPCVIDYKLIKDKGKILLPSQAKRSPQAWSYALGTGIRNFIFLYLPPRGPAVPVLISFTEAELAHAWRWLTEWRNTHRTRWAALKEDFSNWQEVFATAAPGNFLCVEKWCDHWNRCLGGDNPMATANDARNLLGGFFKVDDIEQGGPQTLTIKDLITEELRSGEGDGKEEKPVLTFLETKKKIVLNATRVSQLVELFGKDDLTGKRVKVTFETVKVNNRPMPMVCLREPD